MESSVTSICCSRAVSTALSAMSWSTVVLARAGLARLGRLDRVTEVLDPTVMLPAPGQGALAVETRSSAGRSPDTTLQTTLRRLDDPASRAAVTAERAVLAGLEAGCSAPVGALAVVDEPGFSEPELTLHAVVGSVDGATVRRMSITAPLSEAGPVGYALAARLLEAADAVNTGEAAR
jgi:hydroxymethylbilane synthase